METKSMDGLKSCPRCTQLKLVSEFQKNRSAKDGLQYHCRVCRKEIDARPEKRAQDRARYHQTETRWKDRHIQNIYGISLNEYHQLLESQKGVCAICKSVCSSGRRLAIDHCHKTNRIRGLLCGHCNQSLGKFKEDITILKQAILYLEKSTDESD